MIQKNGAGVITNLSWSCKNAGTEVQKSLPSSAVGYMLGEYDVSGRLPRRGLSTLILLSLICTAGAASHRDREQSAAADTTSRSRLGIVPLPVLYYSPETGIAGGAAVQGSYRSDTADRAARPSSALVDIIYTAKKQIITEIIPDLYFLHSDVNVSGSLRYLNYPDKFFGIGNNTPESAEELYTAKWFGMALDTYRRVWESFSAGPSLYYDHWTLSDVQPNGELSSGRITGTAGGTTFGVGAVARWDTRNNIFSPTRGWYLQAMFRSSSRNMLSDFDFTYATVDLRWYTPVSEHSSFAAQAVTTTTAGAPPFYRLAALGGENTMRGYYLGRYRDRKVLACQGEYRFPVLWRIRGAAFAAMGDVASTMSQFNLHDVKFSGGCGLRYVLDDEEGIAIRVDMGFGRQTSGLYITFNEAF